MKKLLIIIAAFILISCGTTKIVEVPVERIKTEYIDRTNIDTFIQSDSIIVKDKGDTVFLEKYKYLYRYIQNNDTFIKVDTVTKTVTVEVTKEVNRIHDWQIILMVLGGVAIALGLYKLIKLIKKWIQV